MGFLIYGFGVADDSSKPAKLLNHCQGQPLTEPAEVKQLLTCQSKSSWLTQGVLVEQREDYLSEHKPTWAIWWKKTRAGNVTQQPEGMEMEVRGPGPQPSLTHSEDAGQLPAAPPATDGHTLLRGPRSWVGSDRH